MALISKFGLCTSGQCKHCLPSVEYDPKRQGKQTDWARVHTDACQLQVAFAEVHTADDHSAGVHTAGSQVPPTTLQSISVLAVALEHVWIAVQVDWLPALRSEHSPKSLHSCSVVPAGDVHVPACAHCCVESAASIEQLPNARHSSPLKTSSLVEHKPCGVIIQSASVNAVAFEHASGVGSYPGSHTEQYTPSGLYWPNGHCVQFVAAVGPFGAVPTGQVTHSSPVGLY